MCLVCVQCVSSVCRNHAAIVQGKIQPDTRVGRELMNAVASVPEVSAEEFEASLNKGLHDLLMVQYLGSLTQSQICFWQRMQTMV